MIDAIFQRAALADNQLLAQHSVSHVLGVWPQDCGKMEHLPSAPGVALQVIMLLTLFMFQHKHLKWGVRQPRQFNHNIFFWYVSPSSLCCAMTVKGQQVRMFSLILIHPNSSCFSVPFKDHLLEQTSFGLSCRMRRNTPSSLQTKHDL